MPIVDTKDLKIGEFRQDSHQIYNGLDSALTVEIFDKLALTQGSMTGNQRLVDSETYKFSRALQAPYLAIMLRGFRVDDLHRREVIKELEIKKEKIDFVLQKLAHAVWDRPLNPNSPQQLKKFFYEVMKLPEVHTGSGEKRRVTTNREALEKLYAYIYARPIISCILELRDLGKKLSVLNTEVDTDGRMRTSYNIAGTETGRLSSSASAFGTGSNLQNITGTLRRIFIADKGYKLLVIDMEQSESREVGFLMGSLFEDWSYLDMIEAGDLHTQTCRLIWDKLPWTQDIKKDREIAEQIFYRDMSYRDMSKRGGHGSTYLGKPPTIARHLKVPTRFIEDFQSRFFLKIPGIPRWQQNTIKQIQTTRTLTTPFGRTRQFFGRPSDEATWREAVAFVPQSMTSERTNLAIYRIWKIHKDLQLLANGHDAVVLQYPETSDEPAIIKSCLELCKVSLFHKGREFFVPGEAKVGWNWGSHHNDKKPIGPRNQYNPNGLRKWTGADDRRRLSGMDRTF